MVSLEPHKIAEYLYDYANLNFLMLENPTQSCKSLFENYMNNNNRTEDYDTYYKVMLNIYVLFIKMKSFCICEDYNLKNKNNFINNDKLKLSAIRKSIVKSTDYSDISDKKILQLIKDTFCHSSSNNPAYSISPNGKKLEIGIQIPYPITVQLKLNDIISLIGSMNDNAQTAQLIGLEWDNMNGNLKDYLESIKINRYQFTKKIDEGIIELIYQYTENGDHQNVIQTAENQSNCTVKQLELTEKQVNEIITTLNDLINKKIITKEEYQQQFYKIINILINKKFPLPIFKSDYYNIDSYMTYFLQSIGDFSYSDMYNIIAQILPDKEEKEFSFEEHYEKLFKDSYNQLLFKIYYSNHNEKMVYPYMMFIEYIITNYCCKNEYIKIGKHSILSNKLRNSLVHARWYIDDDKIRFYDALPNIANELDYNWEVSINFIDLCEYCTEVLEQIKKEKEEKQKQKTIKI